MSGHSKQELLVFEVSGRYFSMPLSVVEEVVPANVITGVPSSPLFLLGLSAVRGKVLGVIDAACRYGMPPGKSSYFVVCLVRGNLTAIAVDRPVVAGEVNTRELGEEELDGLRLKTGVDAKFIKGGVELLEGVDDRGTMQATGMLCLSVDPDLFVSAEMASRIGETA